MAPSVLSEKLTGVRPITLEDLERFARGLGISASELLADDAAVAPSLRSVRNAIGRQSTQWMRWLDQLERAAAETGGKVIRLTRRMPIVGHIAAGTPILAEENFEGEAVFDAERHFLLRVRGNSMVDAGIYDGDLVHVLKTDDYREGDVIAARVKGAEEATVKYFYLASPGRVLLSPANSRSQMMPEEYDAEDVAIEGKVLGSYRAVEPKKKPRHSRVAERNKGDS